MKITILFCLIFCISTFVSCGGEQPDKGEETEENNSEIETSDDVTYYMIHYCTNYGETPESVKVPEGTVITEEYLPVLCDEDLIFKGWSEESYSSDEDIIAAGTLTVTDDIYLYAFWKKQYTISFVSEYGTAPDTITVEFNANYNKPSARIPLYAVDLPVEEKKFFNGYAYDDKGQDKVAFVYNEDKISVDLTSSNVTLYAMWKDGIIIHLYNEEGTEYEDYVFPAESYPRYHTDNTYSIMVGSSYFMDVFFKYLDKDGYRLNVFYSTKEHSDISGNYYDYYNKFTDGCDVYPVWKKEIRVIIHDEITGEDYSKVTVEGSYVDYYYSVNENEKSYILCTTVHGGYREIKEDINGYSFDGLYLDDTRVESGTAFDCDVNLTAKYVKPHIVSFEFYNKSNPSDETVLCGPLTMNDEYYFDKKTIYISFDKMYHGLIYSGKNMILGIYLDPAHETICTSDMKFSEDKTFYVVYKQINN